MSTRSYISMEVGDNQYKTIYCHFDGYLSYNGDMLLNHYNEREKVEQLLDMGDLSSLREKVDPDSGRPHGFDEQQEDVCVFYGRDRGEDNTQARILRLRELDDPDNYTEYVYIYTRDGEWKYFQAGASHLGLRDVGEDLGAEQAVEQQQDAMKMGM